MVVVELLTPWPPVSTNGSTKTCMVETICSSSISDRISRVCGMVTCQIRRSTPAPSSSAASYSSPGMPCSEAR